MTHDGQQLLPLKASLLARGVRLGEEAAALLTDDGQTPLTVHEYATTGGLTLLVHEGIYVNAPFDDFYCEEAEAELLVADESQLMISFRGDLLPARLLPLPGYLETLDSRGRPVRHTTFSHADRVRASPVVGCSFSCKFCDLAGKRYIRRPLDQLLEGIAVARADQSLPVSHGLVSGGTPSPRDYEYFDAVCHGIFAGAGLPFDVMTPPRPSDLGFVDRLVSYGVEGFAINLELFDDEATARIAPQKRRLGLKLFASTIERALAATGGQGRVRSLVIVGLEPEESTLQAVEFLARLGCDPVLSPFRPARDTPLADLLPPSAEVLERVYLRAREIAETHGVKLGPRCIPCQHNTLTVPDGSDAYYYWADRSRDVAGGAG